ncbi:MAG: hypothetical protein ACM31C_34705 [Acidobacteriota bacterium]
MMRFAILLLAFAACGRPRGEHPDGGGAAPDTSPSSDATAIGDAAPHDAASHDATSHDAVSDSATSDAFPAVLDMHIDCRNDCVLVASPSSISVSAGTGFEVNWINVGDTDCDVAKIDQFNQVPIVLGLAPGTSYLDSVHTWCGSLFTGTFEFRIDICTLPSYIPVNCGA